MFQQQNFPELPTLDAGITLLETDDRATGALQSLVLDHVLLDGGPAVWVDAHGAGTTRPLARLAPSMRVLDQVHIARAFTPWQHQSLLRDLRDAVTATASLVVLPEFDAFYRTDDLGRRERERLVSEGVTLVADLAAERDVPVLVTRRTADRLTRPLSDAATDVLTCEVTNLGPRFSGEAFETLVYPIEDGLVQTTFAFWSRVLADRHPAVASPTADADLTAEVNACGPY